MNSWAAAAENWTQKTFPFIKTEFFKLVALIKLNDFFSLNSQEEKKRQVLSKLHSWFYEKNSINPLKTLTVQKSKLSNWVHSSLLLGHTFSDLYVRFSPTWPEGHKRERGRQTETITTQKETQLCLPLLSVYVFRQLKQKNKRKKMSFPLSPPVPSMQSWH